MKQKQLINKWAGSKQALEINLTPGLVFLHLSVAQQKLNLIQDDLILKSFTISTAKNGLGEEKNSYQTPRGWHMIRAKIGADLPINAVFSSRRFTGEIYTPELNQAYPDRDWILTRILWLSGLEPGFNRLGNVDTMQRYIYIHGSPDEGQFGIPASHGCIRMRNQDVVELFANVDYGGLVYIDRV